ncbi:MAG: SDR family oxidoreductase [Pseudomonadota bacterium]|nr:SDR family oxidoreductase [Pseudomonadota bacterium]
MNPTPSRPVVLVTGAAKRLGRDIALALAAGGWQVAVHYRSSEADALETVADCARLAGDSSACTASIGSATSASSATSTTSAVSAAFASSAAFAADLADEAAVRALLPRVIAHFGRVDAVVNSASTFEYDSAGSFGFAALDQHMHSNTGAAILLAQALHTHITARQATASTTSASGSGSGSGSATSTTTTAANSSAATEHAGRCAVVNLLDQKLWNQNPDFFSYTLSKAALEAAGTMLALALAPLVRVVGVAPGLTLTSDLLSDEQFQARHKLSPLGRSSTPADVAATVKFALENSSLTGTTLLVDGGQHLMRFERDFSLM